MYILRLKGEKNGRMELAMVGLGLITLTKSSSFSVVLRHGQVLEMVGFIFSRFIGHVASWLRVLVLTQLSFRVASGSFHRQACAAQGFGGHLPH